MSTRVSMSIGFLNNMGADVVSNIFFKSSSELLEANVRTFSQINLSQDCSSHSKGVSRRNVHRDGFSHGRCCHICLHCGHEVIKNGISYIFYALFRGCCPWVRFRETTNDKDYNAI